MEVDRLHPNEGYVKNNIVLCCYWCNNAKTDEFTEEEFMPIGKAIGEVFLRKNPNYLTLKNDVFEFFKEFSLKEKFELKV